MKKNKYQTKPTENPYLDNIKGYVDLRSSDKVNVATYKTIAFICLIILIIESCGLIYLSSKSKFIPMIYKENSQGGIQFIGYAKDGSFEKTQNMIANQLVEYIISLRSVPLDFDLINDNAKKIRSMTSSALYKATVKKMELDRFQLFKDKTLKVSITNILPIGKNVWQIDWDENSDGVFIGKFRASITFNMQNNITDPNILLKNPLAMMIIDLNVAPYVRAD